ncbi:MAG: hypothetical protein ACOCW6_00350 [Spirochaetota bacterium]
MPRALPSNNASRRASKLAGVLLCLFTLAVIPGCGAGGDPDGFGEAPRPPSYDGALPTPPPPPPEAGILLSGPVDGKGLSFLPPNVISFSYALYELDENRLEVYFTRDEVFGVDGWETVDCGSFALRRNVDEEVFLYESPDGWSLFVNSTVFLDDPCGLFGGLADRVSFFSRSLGPGQSPLPAVFLTGQ